MIKKHLFISGLLFGSLMVTEPSDAQIFKKLTDKVSKGISEMKTEDAPGEDAVNVERTSESDGYGSLEKPYVISLSGSGPDLYLEYKVTMEGAQSNEYQMDMHMKMLAAPSTGLGRSEMIMKIPVLGEMGMVTLTDAKDPMRIILLNERKRQYTVVDLSTIDQSASTEVYTVKRLGEVELHGLHCIHAKAINQEGHVFELWTTTEIPGYEKLVELYSKTQQTGSGDLWQKLQAAGAAGFMIKLKVTADGGTSVMELTKIENRDVPASLFKIPSGYEKKEGGWAKRYIKGKML